jgi:opine dehydrogenase
VRVTVLGAGAGGCAAVVELLDAGHDVALWNRSSDTLEPLQRIGGVEYEGVLGQGIARPRLITTDLGAALDGSQAIVCTLPTVSHSVLARTLAMSPAARTLPIVLNPGHTGGALEFRAAFRGACGEDPIVAECSTLTYVARKYEPQRVTVTGRAKAVRVAALPGGKAAVEVAQQLFPCVQPVRDVLNTSLANVNMVLHPPGAILASAWIEAKGAAFTFYVEAMTPGVARVMQALDDERLAVASAYGHELPNLIEEMQRIGTVEKDVEDTSNFAKAIASGAANSQIKAPDSLNHRYYLEDFGHGLVPFVELATIAGVDVPTANSLLHVAETLTGWPFRSGGRTAEAMGIAGTDRASLLAMVSN